MDVLDKRIADYKARYDILGIPRDLILWRDGNFVIGEIENTEALKIVVPDFVTHIGKSDDITGGYYKVQEVVLNEGSLVIMDGAFALAPDLKAINFPTSLLEIRDWSFSNSNIEKLVIPDNVEIIGSTAFNRCIQIKEIKLGKSLRKILDHAFSSCENVKEIAIPPMVQVVDKYSFCDCKSLTHVKIPHTVGVIGESSFMRCYNLEKVEWYGKDTSTKQYILHKAAFAHCKSLKEIEIPGRYYEIRKNVFEDCVSLEHVVIKKGVQIIRKSAFNRCTGLKKVMIPEGVVIEHQAFPYGKDEVFEYY